MSPADLPVKVAAKTAVDGASGCWLWTGTLHRRHVGVFRDEVAAANAYDAALITAGLAPVNFPEVAS